MARLRSVLIDCSTGKVYTNVANTRVATTADLIATTRKSTLTLAIKPPGIALSTVTASQGNLFNTSGNFTNITYKWLNANGVASAASGPTVSAASVVLRKVDVNGNTTTVTYTLPIKTASGTMTTTSIPITAGDTFFWDVTNTGNVAGSGLTIIMDYYLGN